ERKKGACSSFESSRRKPEVRNQPAWLICAHSGLTCNYIQPICREGCPTCRLEPEDERLDQAESFPMQRPDAASKWDAEAGGTLQHSSDIAGPRIDAGGGSSSAQHVEHFIA